jgi:hypothetical protein
MLNSSSNCTPRSRTAREGCTACESQLTESLCDARRLTLALEANRITSDLSLFSCSRREAHQAAASVVSKLPTLGVRLVASAADVNLHVVGECMMLNIPAVEDSADVFCIAEELERTLSRALWHTTNNRSCNSLMNSKEERLCTVGKVRLKPVKSCISDKE